jgi:hypothetical protein
MSTEVRTISVAIDPYFPAVGRTELPGPAIHPAPHARSSPAGAAKIPSWAPCGNGRHGDGWGRFHGTAVQICG